MKDTFLGIPYHFDYRGQSVAERSYQIIIVLFGAIGWAYGYHVQDYIVTVFTLIAGCALACLLVLPAWPIYRRHPVKWLPDQEEEAAMQTRSKKKK